MEDKLNDAIWGQLELWDLAFIVKVGKKSRGLGEKRLLALCCTVSSPVNKYRFSGNLHKTYISKSSYIYFHFILCLMNWTMIKKTHLIKI